MRYIVLLVLLMFSGSCLLEPAKDIEYVNNNPIYLSLVNSVIEAWKADTTLPQITHACNIQELGVRFYSDSLFKETSLFCAAAALDGQIHCTNDEMSCPYGCATGFLKPTQLHPLRRGNTYVIGLTENLKLLSNADDTIDYTIRHETIHWLSHCTGHESTQINSEDGMYYFPYAYSDSQHADPRLWNGSNSVLERSALLFQPTSSY